MERSGLPAFGSDDFLYAIVDRARDTESERVLLTLHCSQIEVVVYALRELMVLPDAGMKVPAGMPDRAGQLLKIIAMAANVEFQPVQGPILDS